MAEPTNALNRTILKRYVGRMIGASRNSANWTGTNIDDDVDDYVASGERGFYYHDLILPGEQSIHQWSFLKQTLRVPIQSGIWQYELPEDFGGVVDSYLYFVQNDNAYTTIQLVGLDEILELRSTSLLTTSSYPTHAAVTNIPSGLDRGQRQAVALWPTPSAAFTLTGQYYFNPDGITDTYPYPLGNQQHSETLIESCLSAAEILRNDEEGPHTAKFRRLLAGSILRDRALTTPRFFGYNSDLSEHGWNNPVGRCHLGNTVTYP